jgi:hypothetical protein
MDLLMENDFPNVFAVTGRVRGSCDADQLRAAVEALCGRHPLLAIRIVDRIGPRNTWLTTDGVPAPPVRVLDNAADDDWIDVVEHELQRPFSLKEGPLVRFVLLRGADQFDLVMVTDHLMADGMSFLYLLRDILHQLADPESRPAPLDAPTCWELLDMSASGASGPQQRARLLAGGLRVPRSRPNVVAGPFRVLTNALDQSCASALLERCRSERTTVYAAICTAFVRALVAADPGNPSRRIGSPFHLRDRLPAPYEGAFGTYVGPPAMTTVDTTAPGDFWAAARQFKEELSRGVDQQALAAGLRFLTGMSRLPSVVARRVLRRIMTADCDAWITNLGRLPVPVEYGTWRIEEVRLAVNTGPISRRILGVTEVGGRIFLTLTSFDHVLMQRVLAGTVDELTRVVASKDTLGRGAA